MSCAVPSVPSWQGKAWHGCRNGPPHLTGSGFPLVNRSSSTSSSLALFLLSPPSPSCSMTSACRQQSTHEQTSFYFKDGCLPSTGIGIYTMVRYTRGFGATVRSVQGSFAAGGIPVNFHRLEPRPTPSNTMLTIALRGAAYCCRYVSYRVHV